MNSIRTLYRCFAGLLFTLVAFAATPGASHAQGDADSTWMADTTWNADSAWNELGLDPEGFEYTEDIFGHVSTGWFPQPYFAYSLSYTTDAFYSNTWDRATNMRSVSLHPTTFAFGWENPFEDDEAEILQRNSEETEEDGYPLTNYDQHSLTFLLHPPFPLVLRASAGLLITEGLLFSADTTRSYLSLSGVRRDFKEVGVLYLKEYSIAGLIGINIPVYGGFVKSEAVDFSSYYYLFGGIGASYALSSSGTQYSQIANAKTDIRYGNGSDTATLIDHKKFDGLNEFRTSLEAGIGWHVGAEFLVFDFELFASIPRVSVLEDADWKQYFAGIRMSIGYQWTTEEEEKPLWP